MEFQEYLAKQMKDPEFQKAWEEGEEEYQLMLSILKARNEKNLTQAELAKSSGIRQSNISRIETGQVVPSLATLRKIAKGLDMKLEIRFV